MIWSWMDRWYAGSCDCITGTGALSLQTSYISPQGEFWKLAGGILILFQKLIKLCQTEHPQPKKKKCAKLSKNHWRMFCWVFILRAFEARWAFDGPYPGLTQKHIGPALEIMSFSWTPLDVGPMCFWVRPGSGPSKAHRALEARKIKTQQNIL